jgi:Domain of Unknown Function (DUF1080)
MKLKICLFIVTLICSYATFAQKNKWVKLTDGKTFKNWHVYNHAGEPVPAKWKIEKGAMVFDETAKSDYKVNDLVSDKDYENFVLELEWNIAKGGNSGIFYGILEDAKYNTPYLTAPEIQVLDDENHPDAKQGKNGNRKGGSLYDMIPSASKANVAEQWNKVKIQKLNNEITVWQNGIMAVKYPTAGPEWEAMVADSKFKTWEGFGKYPKGKIGLQDHGNKVSFRKIRIMEL